MKAPIIEYITEEVWRQGHNPKTPDGLMRTAYMLEAWCYALGRQDTKPALADVPILGKLIEPQTNFYGFRQCGVRVGDRVCPAYGQIERLLSILWEQRDTLAPIDFYREFEVVHPFGDGNGRTGKVLMNWLNGTLDNPIFPPSDLWGRPILNP